MIKVFIHGKNPTVWLEIRRQNNGEEITGLWGCASADVQSKNDKLYIVIPDRMWKRKLSTVLTYDVAHNKKNMVLLLYNLALSCLKIFFKHELTELCMYNACASRPSSLIMNLFLFASLHILWLSCLSTMHTASFDWFLSGWE